MASRLAIRRRPAVPEASHHAGDDPLKTRAANRKKLAATERRDAGD
jgi:hypothetical protein